MACHVTLPPTALPVAMMSCIVSKNFNKAGTKSREPGSRAMNTKKAPASAGAFSLCIYLLSDAFKAEGLFRQGEADKFQGLFNGDPLVGFGHKSGFVGKLDLRATQKL